MQWQDGAYRAVRGVASCTQCARPAWQSRAARQILRRLERRRQQVSTIGVQMRRDHAVLGGMGLGLLTLLIRHWRAAR